MASESQDIPLSDINGYPEVAHIVADRPIHHFGGVVSFSYYREHEDKRGEVSPLIELVMEEQVQPHRRIGFRFHGVCDVQFSGWGSIVGLYFQSIRDRGWQNLRFEVGDYEDGCIHLFCCEVSVYDPERVA